MNCECNWSSRLFIEATYFGSLAHFGNGKRLVKKERETTPSMTFCNLSKLSIGIPVLIARLSATGKYRLKIARSAVPFLKRLV